CLTWPVSSFSVSASGVFGDSFGVLTSLFSGLAFAGLIITIVMQRDELALQRQELNFTREEIKGQKEEMKSQNETLRIQRFENTFFKMLELLESCRNDVFYGSFQGSRSNGRDAIKSLYEGLINWYLCEWVPNKSYDREKIFRESCKSRDGIIDEYKKFYEKYGDELGQYYRTLYNVLKLVDRADFIEDKAVYTNLVRAQLSRYELLLLFYNCLSDYGNAKMAPLVRKYSVLKHLEAGMLPEQNIRIWNEFNE
ncbi:MAG: putative phage abortive infection protein, partial [Pedobacter sp.]|nr:putative phage abortive infection protein [Pedobacter sp.]